jgi:hypothetical protein
LPVYHHFYVECPWRVPPSFEPEPWTFTCDRPLGEFAWAHLQSGWLDLFFGPQPLSPTRLGAPDDRQGSPLYVALIENGVLKEDLERLRKGRPTDDPVDTTDGKLLFQIAKIPLDYPVTVTWRVAIAEFIRDPHARLFKALSRYGADGNLRILSQRG